MEQQKGPTASISNGAMTRWSKSFHWHRGVSVKAGHTLVQPALAFVWFWKHCFIG